MTRAAWICLVVAVSTTTAAFGGTSFSSTWKSPDARPGTFQGKKVVAVFINTEEALRQGIEDSLANELIKRGAQGVPAYTLIPTAEIRDEAKAKERLDQSGAAGVVAFRLVGQEHEFTESAATYYSAPTYSSMWGGYWGYGWAGIYDPGYVQMDRVMRVEVLVYSLEQNKLVWAGVSKTTNPKSANALVKQLVDKVASELKKAGLVKN